MDEYISIAPEKTEASDYIDIMSSESEAKAASFPVHLANERAEKLHLALGEKSPGLGMLRGSLASASGEEYERQRISSEYSMGLRETAVASLSNMLRDKKEITPKDMEEARKLMDTPNLDQDTVFETIIGREQMNASRTVEELIKNTGANIDPETVEAFKGKMSQAGEWVAKREYVSRLASELEQRVKNMGYLEWGGNVAGQMVPLLSTYRKYDKNVEGVLGGSNVATQVKDFYFKPLDVGSKELKAKVEELAASNPLVALDFIQSFANSNFISQQIDNLFDVVDIATAPGVGLLNKAGRSLARSGMNQWAQRNQALGNFTQATNSRAFDEVRARALGQTTPQDFQELANVLPSHANPSAYFGSGSGVINPIGVARAVDDIQKFSDDTLKSLVLDSTPVDRINPQVRAIMEQDNLNAFRARYTNTNQSIMDVRWVNGADEGLANVDSLAITLGNHKAQPFMSAKVADNVAKQVFGLEDYTIKQLDEAPGFVIETRRHIDENLPSTYAQMHTPTQGSRWNFLGWMGSADNFVDESNRAARKQTGYGVSGVEVSIRKHLKSIPSITDREFNDFLMAGRDNQVTYYTSKDMERAWSNMFGRLPSEEQIVDYMKVVQLHDLDLALRDTGILAKKASQGFEKHTLDFVKVEKTQPAEFSFDTKVKSTLGTKDEIVIPDAANDNVPGGKPLFQQVGEKLHSSLFSIKGKSTKPTTTTGVLGSANDAKSSAGSLSFEGKFIPGMIPWDKDNEFLIAVWDSNIDNVRYVYKNRGTPQTTIDQMNDLVATQGYKVIQPSPYALDVFRNLDLDMPNYMLVKDFKSSRLSFNQIPKKEGSSHVIYPEGTHFISQADVHVSTRGGTRNSSYIGNNNFLAFRNAAEAQTNLPNIERGRQLLQAGRMQDLQQHLANTLPYTVQEFQQQFRGFGGRFDLNQPFTVRGMGQSMYDNVRNLRGSGGEELYPHLRNSVEGPLNPFNDDTYMRFAQARDEVINTIENNGTALSLRPANLLNPKDSMVQATESLMASRYLDDMKVKAARDFITRYQNLLNISLEDALRSAAKTVENPPWKTTGVDPALLAEARNARRATMEFLHLESQQTKDFKALVSRTYSSIFPEDTLARNSLDWLDELSGGAVTDTVTFARRWAFRLSQISPDAFLTQAMQTFSAVAVGGPTAGYRGLGGMMALKFLRTEGFSDQAIGLMANRYAKATRTSPEHFKEMVASYRKTGFGDISEEHAMAEGLGRPNVVLEGGQKAAHVGLTAYREGERIARETAFSAAYYQWRQANPTTKYTKAIETQILDKADIMAGSMSKASNATWANGVFSVPTQFLRFQFQLWEQLFIGRGLTGGERARLLGAHTLLWGIPTGGLGALGGVAYPWAEYTAQVLRANGVDTDKDKVLKLGNDGVMSVLFEMAYGEKFDVAGRFGPRGISIIKDYQTGRKELVEILAGPSGKLFYDIFKTGKKTLINGIHEILEGTDENREGFVPNIEDVVSILNSAALGRKGYELYHALNFQRWVTKNRPDGVDGVTNSEAVLRFLTGLTPDRIQEHFSKQDALIQANEAKKDLQKQIMEEYRKAFTKMDDPSARRAYLNRIETMFAMGGVSSSERYQIIGKALQDNRDTIESVNKRYIEKFPLSKPIIDDTRDERQRILEEGN